MARDVFISYQSDDKECANRVCEALERQNISCWIAPRDIPVGSEWAAAIVEGIQRCHSFVVILSSHSSSARQISREAELADDQKLPIFTFRIEDVEPPPGLLYFLSNVQWLDAFDGRFETSLARLAEVVRKNAAYPAQVTKLRVPPPAVSTVHAPVPTGRKTATLRIVAIAAICLAIALTSLWMRRPHDAVHQSPRFQPRRIDTRPSGSDGLAKAAESAARAAAERFLNYRDSGDFQAAWRELTAQTRARVPEERWIRSAEQRKEQYGQPSSHTIESCTPAAEGMFNCAVSSTYRQNLTLQETLVLAEERSGRWGIVSDKRIPPK
ncbi:MAG TPA: toll/interleukin-1 receptor domain-containing protein [Bryobacteraceae bacterium]